MGREATMCDLADTAEILLTGAEQQLKKLR